MLGIDGDFTTTALSDSDYSSYRGMKKMVDIYLWNAKNGSVALNETNHSNIWSYSELNTVNLNKNYINKVGTEWAEKIATTTWVVGGSTQGNIINTIASNTYKFEIINPAENINYNAKIGLMYVSDFGYASCFDSWTTILSSYTDTVMSNNWMHMGINEWTITRLSNGSGDVVIITQDNLSVSLATMAAFAIRPVFYLNSNVNKVGDNMGSKTDPIRIS